MLEGTVAFTGRLASMKRADAFALVRKHGGKPREGVTRKTDVLVVGELGWPLLDDGRPSNSLAQAKSHGIAVASERQFLEWLGQSIPDAQAKTYSAAQLGVPEQAAAASRRPTRHVRPDRGARRPVRFPRPRGGAPGRRSARRRHRPVDDHPQPQRDPEMAAGCAPVEPEAVSGILRPAAGRAGAGRTDKTGQFVLDVENAGRRYRGRFPGRSGGRGGRRPRHRRAPLSAQA